MHRSRHHKDNDKNRFYLLPGMGGRMYRQKQKFILKWSIIAALAVAVILAAVMYLINRSHFYSVPLTP